MANGASRLMRSHCAIATSGIAGPDGGTKFKPVGTVWIAVKFNDQTVTECVRFKGDRNQVIQSATNHAMVMLINLLRNCYVMQEDINDDWWNFLMPAKPYRQGDILRRIYDFFKQATLRIFLAKIFDHFGGIKICGEQKIFVTLQTISGTSLKVAENDAIGDDMRLRWRPESEIIK